MLAPECTFEAHWSRGGGIGIRARLKIVFLRD